jgi:hypothetical protein
MYTKIWQKSCKSVCAIDFLSSSNLKVLGLSGFRIGNQIVTDDSIYSVKDAEKVEIRFFLEDGVSVYASVKRNYPEFLELLPIKSEFEKLGFAIIPADFPEFENVPSLILCKSCELKIGLSIAVIGYQFEHRNLALKSGIISALYTNGKGLSFIQYDGTLKPGNSGAPLLDVATGRVLGIVTNREMGFSKPYKELMDIIDSNLKVLKEQEGKSELYDVDLAQVLFANQSQIKHITREFFLNATFSIRYALEIGHVVEYLETKMELDTDSNAFCD